MPAEAVIRASCLWADRYQSVSASLGFQGRRRRSNPVSAEGAGGSIPALRLSAPPHIPVPGRLGRQCPANLPTLFPRGVQVRRRRHKRLPIRERTPLRSPERPHQRWSLDFVSDALWNHRRCRVLNIVDPCTRECPGPSVDTSISGKRLARYLDELAAIHGYPEELVHDNGPELTRRALFEWSQRTGVKQRFIEPGKPIQNAYVESFNGQFRDECLNEQGFANLAEARQIIEAWEATTMKCAPIPPWDIKPQRLLSNRATDRNMTHPPSPSLALPFPSWHKYQPLYSPYLWHYLRGTVTCTRAGLR